MMPEVEMPVKPRGHFYSEGESIDILLKLEAKGINLDGSEYNCLTIHDLDLLANCGAN